MVELKKVTQLQWRRFLATEHGENGLAWLNDQLPNIAKGNPDEIIFDAGKVEGFRLCLSRIIDMLAVEPQKDINPDNI